MSEPFWMIGVAVAILWLFCFGCLMDLNKGAVLRSFIGGGVIVLVMAGMLAALGVCFWYFGDKRMGVL